MQATDARRSRAASAAADPAVSVRGLSHSYGDRQAVKGIDLEIAAGEIFALLGPNGAGKTTTVEILEGFRRRSGGEVSVLGLDPAHGGPEWRARIGVVLQQSSPEPELTARECLALYAGYYRNPRDIQETIELVGLGEVADGRCEQLSGGECRRLDVALALIGDPELLFLDEPTTGFDPAARRATWKLVADLRALGKTILLTTHYMEEAERLADRIAVISSGEIIASGTPQTLGARELMDVEISFTLPDAVALAELPAALELGPPAAGGFVQARAHDPVAALHALTCWAIEHEVLLEDLEVRRPSLEDVYLKLVNTATEEA